MTPDLLFSEDVQVALAAVRETLRPDGRFAFETRNPAARAWESWVPANAVEVTDADGQLVRVVTDVETPVHEELVSFTHTFSGAHVGAPRVSRSTLRFLGPDALTRHLVAAGLEVVEQYGDWDRRPISDASPEIITITRRTQ